MASASVFADCGVKLPKGWNSSSVEVPFDWSNPSGEKIKVSYYFKDQKQYQEKTPIVFFNGGPTIAGNSAIGVFSKPFTHENIIFLDQRGTGCSTPFKKYNGNLNEYRLYASDSIVKDAEVIRKELFGDRKWKIFGQSYGGLISFRYLELAPEAIASAHIHGFGFSPDGLMLDKREERIAELTPEIMSYKPGPDSLMSIGDMIQELRTTHKDIFNSMCFETRDSLKKNFCGEDIFTGLFMITGFKNYWSRVHQFLVESLELIEKNNISELQRTFTKFAKTYLLRFGDVNQTAALHSITYYELIPGRFFYSGCSYKPENDLISECRFQRQFLIRTGSAPTFVPKPHNLTEIRKNIITNEIPVYYYAGHYDTFLPVQTLTWTAKELGIEDSLIIFPDSGHDGYYSEKLVLDNLKK